MHRSSVVFFLHQCDISWGMFSLKPLLILVIELFSSFVSVDHLHLHFMNKISFITTSFFGVLFSMSLANLYSVLFSPFNFGCKDLDDREKKTFFVVVQEIILGGDAHGGFVHVGWKTVCV